jgi:hypothetical protein
MKTYKNMEKGKPVLVTMTPTQKQKVIDFSVKTFGRKNVSVAINYLIEKYCGGVD